MIALKKNDKLIIIVGVAVIIVAAILIAVYTSPEGDVKEIEDASEKTFEFTWIKQTGTTMEDGYAGKRAPYSEPITVSAPYGCVLTNVEIQVNWEDDYFYRGLLSKGYDTLTAEIALSGGTAEIQESVGGGNMTFSFNINGRPAGDSVDAKSVYDAEDLIESMFSGDNDASFDVIISVKTGERMWRPLKFLKDKGNGFEFEITYDYYKVNVIDVEDSNNEEDQSTGLDDGKWLATIYQSISLPGRT